ncbi:copper amine oxidase N-terminal domain-containing protein [Paenibacillus segetis]|uniref:Copper amine oxidase-like N-terminal domain-containing protein n=1 Tax=Paenibacillus segetis TaxID=1325360 RepID=A0ABQ1YH61_9BACL|nr:copper amine oxidase N-terminal domain-containing protein [Paenibacillus segetis]GGH25625.1 hypothetical protein GCM10008013_26030 [Paenibacillus segetis]
MKRICIVLLTCVLGFSIFQFGSSAGATSAPIVGSPKLAVLVDGRKVKFEGGEPVTENNHVQVPLRGIGEALGAKVGFSGKTVTYVKDEKTIELTLDSKLAIVDGKTVTMETAAKAVKGRTYVPLRFVSENLGETVSWDQVGNWVWIGDKEIPEIEDVTELEDLDPLRKYFIGLEFFLESFDKKFTEVRKVSYETMPVHFKNTTIMDMWMVTDGKNYGIHVRYKGPKRFVINMLCGDGNIRSRTGHVTEQTDGTYIAQFPIVEQGDSFIVNDKNWKNFKIGNVDYFFFPANYDDDSVHLFENPLK